jgi:hypothetical protein
MGRPVNKRYFGSGAGNQLKVRAKVGANAEGDGVIISQRSSYKFKVNVGGNIGVCTLVAKPTGTLAANEMTISVLTEGNVVKQVSKLYNRTVIVDGAKVAWNFSAALDDGAAQAADADAAQPTVVTITINTHPADVTSLTTASFSVAASITAGHTLKYRWQVSTNGGTSWTNITNGIYTGSTSATLNISDVTGLGSNMYRVAVSATGVSAVHSNPATLTVA